MTLLSPLALLWLLSLPVLVWLWRFASTRHQIRVSSLIPFEHLTKRAPRRRRRVVVNWLFWLQLAALAATALALAQPAIPRRANTTLVILDTSASMGAEGRPLDRARRALKLRAARKAPTERWFIVATAPVIPLTRQPTSEGSAIAQALDAARAAPLGGNLTTASRLGQALLGGDPDRILVASDEPAPSEPLPKTVEWIPVGRPRANVGLVGVDARQMFCGRDEPRIIATVHNFSQQPSAVTIAAVHERRQIGELHEELAPGERRAVSLPIPPEIEGFVELRLTVPRDGLEADNHASVRVHPQGSLPVVLRAASPRIEQTLSRWLAACDGLTWSREAGAGAHLVVTDHPEAGEASPALVIAPPRDPQPIASRWVMGETHPIAAYLSPLDPVAAAIDREPPDAVAGTPVIWALVQGRRIPVAAAEERNGVRRVVMHLDPSAGPQSTPVLLLFYNSLRWLMGEQPAEGQVIDPLESNLLAPASTWRSPRMAELPPRARPLVWHPLSHWLLGTLLLLLMAEWRLYTRRRA